MGLVTLLTDFGTQDYYVGAMKGVLAALAPGVQILDITHEIPPGDVTAGAFVLEHAVQTFPRGTVHCVVVDPGVGTERRAIVCASAGHLFVGPDNGVLSWAVGPGDSVWVVERFRPPEEGPATFHGRDLFAPVAGRLAAGMRPEEVGPPVEDMVRLARPEASRRADGALEGEVVHVDRFGNLITSVPGAWLRGGSWRVVLGDVQIAVARTFGDVPPGRPVAYVGSAGLVEVAVRNGSAAQQFGAGRGTRVELVRAGEGR